MEQREFRVLLGEGIEGDRKERDERIRKAIKILKKKSCAFSQVELNELLQEGCVHYIHKFSDDEDKINALNTTANVNYIDI